MASTEAAAGRVRHSWLHRHDGDDISYAHMAMLEAFTAPGGEALLAGAFQASGAGCEGAEAQHLRFCLSRDGGESWEPSVALMWGLQALWSPVLHFHEATQRLYLFYSESRKARTPGGDIKHIYTLDCGKTWSAPTTILTHEESGEVPKVLANKLLVLDGGTPMERWVLPFWREPFNSFLEYPAYHPMKDSPPMLEHPPPPGALVPQSKRNSAGVLLLDNPGSDASRWWVAGDIHDPSTWLIENTLERLSNGHLLMLFRSGTGAMWQSASTDRGESWRPAVPAPLPNPNSKFSMCRAGDTLVVCYNHSSERRAPLDIATSKDDGASWQHRLSPEPDPDGHFAYPTVIHAGSGQLLAAYSFWGEGIRVARFQLSS